MYVIVGIPSFNEADSIAGVVRAADRGLTLLARTFPDLRALILNVDSNSPDGTARAFLGTATSWDKKAITTQGDPGKGKNILAMIALAQAGRADGLLMLDGDLESAEPEWIVSLARPVLRQSADFVTPDYERTLFDGAITCHFAWPLLLSVFGRDIRQPIAGDFALGRRLLAQVGHEQVGQESVPPSVSLYGIDIHLTLTAVTQDMRLATAPLGGKRHKPSYPKLLTMFPQVANAAAPFVARSLPAEPTGLSDAVERMSFLRNAPFAQRDDATRLLSSLLPRAAELCRGVGWLSAIEGEVLAALADGNGLSAGPWSKILAAWICQVRAQPRDAAAGGGEDLTPFFMIRAVTFWLMVASAGEEAAIRDLKQVPLLLHEQLANQSR
ncbi:glycosyltransferase [soil metagenome]